MDQYQEYQVLEELGFGSQSSVKKVKNISTGLVLALKQHDDHADAEREITMMRAVSANGCNTYVACYKDTLEIEGGIGIVMEYFPGKTLKDTIKYSGIQDRDLLMVARDVFKGLGYIHARGVVHNDISTSNILYNGEKIKIIDFGMACFYRDQNLACEPEKTVDNLFELETEEIVYNRDLYPGLDVIKTGIMLWRILNPTVGSATKARYFIGMTKEYQTFVTELTSAQNRPSYYILNSGKVLSDLQETVDSYTLSTKEPQLEDIIRRATIVDPYQRPSAEFLASS